MLRQLFGFGQPDGKAAVDRVYGSIVAAARQPVFYADWDVSDTPLGRYEMMSLHMVLVLHRLKGETEAAGLAQELTDAYFRDLDHSLRDLGIGDLGIGKRIKKLARMFYGRAHAYGQALQAGDHPMLAAALRRNVVPDQPDWRGSDALATYALAAHEALRSQPVAAMLDGAVHFPAAAALVDAGG